MSGRVVTLKTKVPNARPQAGAWRAVDRGHRPGLRERIARQDIAPGAKLREQELADEFGVPRTRIREVFGVLESRGLIERIPNRGAVVSRLELEHVFQLYEVRAVLEGMCVRLATQNVPPETWHEFVELFGAPMDGFVKAGDFDSFIVGLRALPPRDHRLGAQSRRGADARQHLREDQRGDPAHRHPARPRPDRASASIAPSSRPCAPAMPKRPSG